jgi:hypothetical protein
MMLVFNAFFQMNVGENKEGLVRVRPRLAYFHAKNFQEDLSGLIDVARDSKYPDATFIIQAGIARESDSQKQSEFALITIIADGQAEVIFLEGTINLRALD